MQNRQSALNDWLKTLNKPMADDALIKLAGDASFRGYYRLKAQNRTYIIMDAPPDKENSQAFIAIAERMREHGLKTPFIHAMDEQQGFLLLEDFGDQLLLPALTNESADQWYQTAMDALVQLQTCSVQTLPLFDESFIRSELELCREWFFKRYLQLDLSTSEETLIDNTFQALSHAIAKQPQVFIHRDYHSRNLMILKDDALGIIDFQDAMLGPVTYDLVSLLKDCYIQWPKARIQQWINYFYNHSYLAQTVSEEAFIQAFELAGLQRHLKVLGVFSRLHLRDNKPHYLKDLPLVLHYVMDTLEGISEWHDFYHFMQQRVCLP